MPVYQAPIRDIRFVSHELLDLPAVLTRFKGYEDATTETIDAILELGARFCEEVLLPLNAPGDAQGCRFEDGEVRTPDGFREAYQRYCEIGLSSLSVKPEFGGQGMPQVLKPILGEMICATNFSFGTYPGLSRFAFHALRRHASPEIKALYLPRLASGIWAGTMCLTESHCGTDLGLIRTRAVPQPDGGYLITGTKIFVTAGEHDLTENIAHLVLARLPDAPAGIRGLSLFLVPKYLPEADGTLGERNGVICGSLEQKMGSHASATCILHFDAARGDLVGEANRGMRCMFSMMNAARLAVSLQGLGLAEIAYQNALHYAHDRLQGRALDGPRDPGAEADPIIVHPDVRRMLLTMKAYTEGGRAFAMWIGLHIDISRKSQDPEEQQAAEELVGLMTPIIKAFLTDIGSEVTNLALQVYGGHGYIVESGIEQFVRDARIAQIWEGTNGIQALDLVARKLGTGYGRLLRQFFRPVAQFIEEDGDPRMAEFLAPLQRAFSKLQQASLWIAERGQADPDDAAAAATEYLRLFALVTLGYLWARMAKVAQAQLDAGSDDQAFYTAKLATARFYFQRLLPQSSGLLISLTSGARELMAPPEDSFPASPYRAPLRDIRFLLHDLLEIGQFGEIPGFEDPRLIDTILTEGGRFFADLVYPLNRSGDTEGCHFEDGNVRLPEGFSDAYRKYIDGGWTAVSCDPEYGGHGMPVVVQLLLDEFLVSCNLSFAVYPGLSRYAYDAIALHGDEEIRRLYLPHLTRGTWSGAMCLTEPQCGTDLGLVRTKAIPKGDGTFALTGTKIFITAGEHDLTENIVSLVLARLPSAPSGVRGISLFLVPKYLVSADGSLGDRNGVVCGSIEKKMGVKATATCTLYFEEAIGTLIGQPHQGMRAMFTMMNRARIAVATEGLGLAEIAYQRASHYALDRLQGRALHGPRYPEREADPIIVHPDIRRMLLTMKANIEGGRALVCWIGVQIDIARQHPDPERRLAAEDFVSLMTPIAKAFLTDFGFEVANLAMQVFGGHGYIKEHGIEQLVRDARIAQIWEGTNGIQALDLTGRKLGQAYGRLLRRFFGPVTEFLARHQHNPEMQEFLGPLAKSVGWLQQATLFVANAGQRDPNEVGAAATDYLRLFALTAMAYLWAWMAQVALENRDGEEAGFYLAKITTARFFFQRLWPESRSRYLMVMAGGQSIMEPDLASP